MFLKALKHYAWQMVQGCVQGGAISVKAFIGAAVVHTVAPGVVPALDWQQALAIFGASAFYHAWDYLSRNPLPTDSYPEGTESEPEIKQEVTEGTEKAKTLMTNAVIALAIFFGGCAAPQYSPVPPASTWTNSYPEGAMRKSLIREKLASLKAVEAQTQKTEVLTPTSNVTNRTVVVAWNYNGPTNMWFEVWRASEVNGPFSYWVSLPQKQIAATADGARGFFRVRARDLASGQASDWGTTRAGQ